MQESAKLAAQAGLLQEIVSFGKRPHVGGHYSIHLCVVSARSLQHVMLW